ncbi:uncharacterized protein LOC114745935 [Neltuma alba]|uniref:uncharacterized protein LOC114745935 n=1 Tax=Neltuma alba TaxID=207710 RepID=UPI0010A4C55E|nr:uncharacterized protein LOC114745935 [Prosopis alba]
METNGLGGGIFPGMSSGMLGVDNSSQQQQQNLSNPPNPHHLHSNPQVVSYAPHHDLDPHPHTTHAYPYSTKSKQQTALSDEEEPGFAADDSSGDPKSKNISPWQRMKWTDTMVRLLIMAVYYIGDEAVSEGTDPSGKKKPAGLLQKKGKWKSVSRAMMEKGFYVSPQQCEDKFNDLNKRYKRVNDILGRGTACRVVENQSLLETMDLSPKMKEEARKLLNSKHLFFREMCAYHNSCGHGVANGPSAAQPSPEVGTDHHPATAAAPLRQQCSHATESGLRGGSVEDESDFDSDSESDAYSEEEEDESVEGQNGHEQEEEDEMNEGTGRSSRKRKRKAASQAMQQLSGEVTGVLQDGGRSAWEKKQWMKTRLIQLEEQQVRHKMRAFDLEKQRLKWARFSSKKEREMERAKLENERRKLETERMLLMFHQREIELLGVHQQQHSSN